MPMNTYTGVIPARYASSRFPGKPLVDISGKSMIQRVYQQATKSMMLNKVVVATDDDRIFEHVRSFGGNVVLTAEHHKSGTERCREAAEKLNLTGKHNIIVNIQGDEPCIDASSIDKLCNSFLNSSVDIATLMYVVNDEISAHNPNHVKLVTDAKSFARYFSRSPIPFYRESQPGKEKKWMKHIGLYAYRAETLEVISNLLPSASEIAESLEQLRWLDNGFEIFCIETDSEPIAVDTPEDLKRILDTCSFDD
jgi:3-deoxy-manno-octulosonate cytidylyltransferase (CMP-KDO synthetase)